MTTTLELAPDLPLAAAQRLGRSTGASHGPAWWLGKGTTKNAFNREPYRRRPFHMGAYPFEKLKRRDEPTTFIDEPRVPRFPKRADFFARAVFGDMGKEMQNNAKGGFYVQKSRHRRLRAGGRWARCCCCSSARRAGRSRPRSRTRQRNAAQRQGRRPTTWRPTRSASRAVPNGPTTATTPAATRCRAYHKNAVSMLYDQGHETFEGASGDDWISVAQSMRAYLRFSLLGGIIAEQIRRLGYSARVHSVLDGDVLQPPLLLLSGLGEVSRIGEVILNPYLGPAAQIGRRHHRPAVRLRQAASTSACRPSAATATSARANARPGAITAGPKLMYNGYEIWKSDAEKCARYRITNQGGGDVRALHEDLPVEPGRAVCRERPSAGWRCACRSAARWIARLDDRLGRGGINPVKKWWWDIELDRATDAAQARRGRRIARGLNLDLDLKYEDQTLAVYPADVMPPPYPVAHPGQPRGGHRALSRLLTPDEHKARLARGETEGLVPQFKMPEGPPPVFPVIAASAARTWPRTSHASSSSRPTAGELPKFDAGAHVDVVIAPEYLRQYSLAGDPADSAKLRAGRAARGARAAAARC